MRRHLSSSLLLICTLTALHSVRSTDIAISNSSPATAISPATRLSPSPAPTVSLSPKPAPSPSPLASPIPTNGIATNSLALVTHDLPEIRGKIGLPKDWTLLPGKLLEGDVLLATREKITSENDPWTIGLSMTIDRNGAKDSGQKASAYALSLATEAREKAGDEATPLKESQAGGFHEIRFEFPISADQPLQVTELLRANDSTGTLAVILWQTPKSESPQLQGLRDAILAGLTLDPNQ